MTVKGSTALVRLAGNPNCEILGAMVMQEGSEKRFYERVVGEAYDREFGERQSSKRRGAQFEQNAYAGDARLLRGALASFLSAAADDVIVRNLFDDYPGTFIVRENEVAKGDLARVRLQLGAQLLALRHEYNRIDPAIGVPAHGMVVFSKPNGLIPHAPRMEDIGGAVEAIRIGVAAFLHHRQRVNDLRAGAEPYTVVADLQPNFQDACLAACVMAQWCRQRVVDRAADMGDAARDVLGDVAMDRVIGLMTGAVEPADDHERILAVNLRTLANQHRIGRAA